MKIIIRFTLITLLAFQMNTSQSQVVINEYSAANRSTIADNFGFYEDWIELFNQGGTAVDLTGYYLSDKLSNPQKFEIPGGSIPANGRIMVFCSKRSTVVAGEIHTSFKLTQTKNEDIVLSDASGTVIDSQTIQPNLTEHSRGRTTDGATTWSLFTIPTPNASNNGAFQNYSERPTMSMASGGYAGSVSVDLATTDPTATIRYTTDGSEPTNTSATYSGSITINNTTVLKARGFSSDANISPSFIESNTYFIDESHTIKVISIAGDEITDFLNDNAGSAFDGDFVGSFEYFDENLQLIDEGRGDYNKHGNDSWAYAQRGFDFIMRDQFGYNYAVRDEIFPTKNRNEYQRLIIKAAANDNYPAEDGAHIRDSYVHHLSQIGKLKMDERSWAPCIIYVDGVYWGVYDIREKVDDSDFTDEYYDQDEAFSESEDYIQFLKTWGSTWADYGDPQSIPDWNTFKNWVAANDVTIPANWNYVDSVYNWKSLVDYVVLNSVIVSKDWLNWNTAWWRGRDPNGDKKKWRYVLWDMDASFGHYVNYTGIQDESADADPCNPESLPDPGGQGHVPILNKLMTNEVFQQYYQSRYIDLNNTVFSCDNMIAVLDSMVNIIAPEMPDQIARWGGSMAGWEANVQKIRDFITQRCASIETGLIDCYDLDGPYDLTFDVFPVGAGEIKANSVWLPNYVFSGTYYGGINILLQAKDNTGFTFDHWEIGPTSTINPLLDTAEVILTVSANDDIVAYFIEDSTFVPPIEEPTGFTGFHIPNAFSPNGDNLNDFYAPLVGYDVASFEFIIFDRWGQEIFRTSDPEITWDGTMNGDNLSTTVVVYQAVINFTTGLSEKRTGNITLMR